MTTTPFMNLLLPDVSITVGPTWAAEINAAMALIDSHDHSAGNGVKISQNGIALTGDFDLVLNNLINTRSLRLQSQGSPLALATDKGIVYRVGGDLYWNNSSGAAVQITNGGSLASVGSGVMVYFSPGAYPYAVLGTDGQKVIGVDTVSPRTLNLPVATSGIFIIVKDQIGSAQTNNISIVPNGTDTIDGSNSTFLIDYNFGSVALMADGISKWLVC